MVATAPNRTKPDTRARSARTHMAFSTVLALALTVGHGSVLARGSDAKAPIEVEADSTEFDNQSQRHTLLGDVKIRQGTMSVNAERIVLQLAEGRLVEINATGNPLTFSIEDDTGATVTAKSDQLLYKPLDARLSLLGSAELVSDGRELSGERIDYDIAKANVQALSGGQNRVRVVIDPNVVPNTTSGN